MSVLKELLNLLSGPTGGMAYHLILLFSIWAIVGLALSRLSYSASSRSLAAQAERAPRILIAGALISLSRFLLIVVALIDRQDGVSLVRMGPPLERFVDTLSALLICSAFVLPLQKKTLNRLLIGILGALTLGLYVVSALQWANILNTLPAALYNRATQRWVWELWQLAFLAPALVYVLIGPVKERDALGASLSVLLFAHLAQALYPVSSQIPHAAGWVRLANLIAFPLLGVSTYLLIFQRFEAEAAELQDVNEQSLAQITNLISLLEASTQIARSLDLNNVLRSAVETTARELQSDLCALALVPTTGAPPGAPEASELELAVVFDTPDVFYENTRFRLAQYPIIQHAIAHNRPAILGDQGPEGYDVSTSPAEAAAVFALLQSEGTGPLIVQPIQSAAQQQDGEVIGALLVCRTGPGRTFSSDEAQKSESLAAYLGPAIENAHRYSEAEARIEQLAASQDSRATEHVRTRTDLENRLQKSEEQAAAYMQRLYEAERGEQQALKDAHEVRREMARLQQESQQELVQAKREIRLGIEHNTRLTQRIAELDAERIRLTNLAEALQIEEETQKLRLAMSANDRPHTPADTQPKPDAGAVPRTNAQGARLQIDGLLQDLGQPATDLLQDTERLANGSLGTLDSRQRALLGRVRVNAERVSYLLGNLTALRDIGRGTLAPRPIPTHIAHLIRRALDSARFRLEARQLRTRLAIGALPVVHVDPDIIQRILDNLLDILCRSVQEGTIIGIQASIDKQETQSHAASPQLRITLSGTRESGCPDPESTSKPEDDYAIAEELARVHGGQIGCVHKPGVETTFHLTVPAQPVDARSTRVLRTGDRRG